jgi:kynurenine formamidase
MTRFIDLGHLLDGGAVTSARFAEESKDLPLASVAGIPGVVIDAPVPPRAVSVQIDERAVEDKAVLIRTGWDKRWGSDDYHRAAPYVAPETVDALAHGGATLVGLDFCTAEAAPDLSQATLVRLLRAGVLVVDNLCNLSALPTTGFRFFAVPQGVADATPLPVRAFAELLPPRETVGTARYHRSVARHAH